MKNAENRELGAEKQTFALEFLRPVTLSPCHLVTLVIGYGNDLRGDDAVGPRVAAAVAGWALPGVRALAVHQLMPELAEDLAAADLAIFVDATAARDTTPDAIALRPIVPAPSASALGHTGDPGALLALAEALYGRRPAAWAISVPAHSFAFGARLSPTAERGLASALRQIRALIPIHTE